MIIQWNCTRLTSQDLCTWRCNRSFPYHSHFHCVHTRFNHRLSSQIPPIWCTYFSLVNIFIRPHFPLTDTYFLLHFLSYEEHPSPHLTSSPTCPFIHHHSTNLSLPQSFLLLISLNRPRRHPFVMPPRWQTDATPAALPTANVYRSVNDVFNNFIWLMERPIYVDPGSGTLRYRNNVHISALLRCII